MNTSSLSPSWTPRRAGLAAGAFAFLPALAFVLTRSAAHWPSVFALGAASAIGVGLLFGLYFRLALAIARAGRSRRRVRVGASAELDAARLLDDPLADEDAELEARFAALEHVASHQARSRTSSQS